MSDVRDPATDQQLPAEGREPAHQAIIDNLGTWGFPGDVRWAIERGVIARRELGVSKYGRPLESHNGRDWLQDAWEEALDLAAYEYQGFLEGDLAGNRGAHLLSHVMATLEILALMKIARGDAEVS